MGSAKFTNLLLLGCTALLIMNLAIPAMESSPGPAPVVVPEKTSSRELLEMKAALEELRIAIRFQAPAAALAQKDPEDALVVRIPGRLADEWGLTAEDVRGVVNALVSAGKNMRGRERSRRPSSSDMAAIATLRNFSSAQAQFQATAKADTDHDGTGEFGSLVELSGAKDVRGDERVGRLNPPVLSGAFRTPSENGLVSRSGFYFRVYLPDSSGGGVVPDAVGFGRVDSDLAEVTWCCYAWPVNPESGKRTYFINQTGDVLATKAQVYTGSTAPVPGAAFKNGGRYSITGLTAVGIEGQDGNVWVQVN